MLCANIETTEHGECVYFSYTIYCRSLLGQINRQACVFTFGYGSEHDADSLHAIADAGNGLFYYIDNSDSIPESFCDCLGGLLSVAAQVSTVLHNCYHWFRWKFSP